MAHLGLNLGDGFGTDAPCFMKAHAACAVCLENALDHDAAEMDVGMEQGAKNSCESRVGSAMLM